MSKIMRPALSCAALLSIVISGSAVATSPVQSDDGSRLHHVQHATEPATDKALAALGDLTITQVFSRATVARSGAAYLVVTNDGDEPDRLIAADAPVAARVELHNMTVVDDVMRMAEVEDGVEIPAHGAVTLAPGGLHVMMMGLNGPLEIGTSFPLTLTFERAGQVTIDVPVLDATAEDTDGHDMN